MEEAGSVCEMGIRRADQNQSVHPRRGGVIYDLKLTRPTMLSLKIGSVEFQGCQSPGVVSKSEKQQHDHITSQ